MGVPRQRRGGGIPQSGSFPHGFVLSRSANCESLSQKSKIFASSLWQGSLFAPGIVLLCDTGLFQALNRQRGNEAPQKPHSKTGAVAKTYHPSQSEGSISVGSTRGILKGGTIRAGASCSPLKPASLLPFLPEQERKAPLASARSASGVNFAR